MEILVTGATGFLGQRLCSVLNERSSFDVTAVVRAGRSVCANRVVEINNIGKDNDWSTVLEGARVVIHAAARAHIMKDEVDDPLAEYRKVNVDGTLNLAHQAAKAGIKRFIFISSIKVNGEQTHAGSAFRAEDPPAPEDPYGISKYEAESGLMELASTTGMEVVIIRPPLVYGPDVKGNFASMINIVRKGVPIPFGAIANKRSLVGIDNLVDLIVTCVAHPKAANQIFLASDGKDLSTTELLRAVADARGRKSRLIPVPSSFLTFCASVLGKRAMAQRLVGSLQVDISKTREVLDWEPPVTVEEGLRRCFVSQKS